MIDSKDVPGRKLGDSHQELTDKSEVCFQGAAMGNLRSRELSVPSPPTVYSCVVADSICFVYPLRMPCPRKSSIDATAHMCYAVCVEQRWLRDERPGGHAWRARSRHRIWEVPFWDELCNSFPMHVRQTLRVSGWLMWFFFFSVSPLVDKEIIYRERKGNVILRNVETNNSTVLIEGKKIVSTLSNDQDYFRGIFFSSCKSIKQKMTLSFNFWLSRGEALTCNTSGWVSKDIGKLKVH